MNTRNAIKDIDIPCLQMQLIIRRLLILISKPSLLHAEKTIMQNEIYEGICRGLSGLSCKKYNVFWKGSLIGAI